MNIFNKALLIIVMVFTVACSKQHTYIISGSDEHKIHHYKVGNEQCLDEKVKKVVAWNMRNIKGYTYDEYLVARETFDNCVISYNSKHGITIIPNK